MAVDYRAPNINARRLGRHFRQIREALRLSYDEAAEMVGCEVTWLIRLETGFEQVTPDQVRLTLDRYEVPEHRIRTVLLDLATRQAGPPWLAGHAGRIKALVRDLLTLESESPVIHTYGILVLPELVRTEAYARMCLEYQVPGVDVDREWDLLDNRQRHRPGGRRRILDVILDETAITRPAPRPEVMRDQLGGLIALSEDPRATVRVIPMSVGAHAGLEGAFDVMEFPHLDDRVSTVHGALGIDLAYGDLTGTWRLLEKVALPPPASRAMIRDAMEGLSGTA
jgi:transcriptional regulator with XRE-family HTH domain